MDCWSGIAGSIQAPLHAEPAARLAVPGNSCSAPCPGHGHPETTSRVVFYGRDFTSLRRKQAADTPSVTALAMASAGSQPGAGWRQKRSAGAAQTGGGITPARGEGNATTCVRPQADRNPAHAARIGHRPTRAGSRKAKRPNHLSDWALTLETGCGGRIGHLFRQSHRVEATD